MPDFERWIEPYFRDSALWPVLAVAATIAVTLLAMVLVLAIADRNLAAMAALLALGWMSVDATLREVRTRRSLGLVGGAIFAVWVLGAAAAIAARWSGIL
jgi:hypothetical protein